MQPIKNWHWTEKLLLAGGAVAVIAAVGRPILAGPIRDAVMRRAATHSPRLDRIVLRVDEALQLNLTDAQKQAVKPVLVDAFVQMRHLRRNDDLTPEARQAALKQLREATHARLAAILTADQMAKLDAARAHFDLGLSPEQKTQMKSVVRESFDRARAIRDDGSLTAEGKRLKIIDLHTATHAKVAAILTSEQRSKVAARFTGGYLTNILAAELDLSAQQRPQVQSIVDSSMHRVNAVFADTTTSPRQKQRELRDIRKVAKTQLDQLLTPAQQSKLDGLKPFRDRGNLGLGALLFLG